MQEPAILFDEDSAVRGKLKDDSFEGQLDPAYNPEEDGIDPVIMYRFAENTRRLDRLRAELSG